MGTCWNCNTEVTLKADQTQCDNCGEIIFYRCNDCKGEFDILDKESKNKLEECKFCGYFKCPYCGVCSWSCERYKWERELLKKFSPEVTTGNCPKLLEKIREIIDYFEDIKVSTKRMSCPERGVPISYAKNRIKSLLAKFEGFRVKDEGDRDAFLSRFKEITAVEIGEERTVSGSREKGSYGQEYRDAFNLAVCLGKFEIRRVKKKDSEEEYDLFVRCEKPPCRFLARDDLVVTHCERCKKKFPKGMLYCDVCPPYQKGKDAGGSRKLKERLSNKDTCQVYRGDFKKKDGGS